MKYCTRENCKENLKEFHKHYAGIVVINPSTENLTKDEIKARSMAREDSSRKR